MSHFLSCVFLCSDTGKNVASKLDKLTIEKRENIQVQEGRPSRSEQVTLKREEDQIQELVSTTNSMVTVAGGVVSTEAPVGAVGLHGIQRHGDADDAITGRPR